MNSALFIDVLTQKMA